VSDPTDDALATIASILDQTRTPPEKAKPTDRTADKAAEPAGDPPVSIAMPPPLPTSVEIVTVEAVSITTVSTTEAAPAEPSPAEPPPIEQAEPAEQAEPNEPEANEPLFAEAAVTEPESSEPEPIQPQAPVEANGYSKSGPGPMAALRFHWTVREDNGQYYVDETVGQGSTPLVNGPMDSDAAIKFVDDREAEARQRFEHFKHEMISRSASLLQARRDSNDV
jgi:hypothetical protein